MVERIADHGAKTVVVIDTGPDFRDQMISAKVTKLDAAVYTHAHADHIHGIDDLRGYWLSQKRLIYVYADAATMERLREGFGYCFETPAGSAYPPIVAPRIIQHDQSFEIVGDGGGIMFEPLVQQHGSMVSLGFRIGNFGYCPDVSDFPADTVERLRNLDVLVIDALQHRPHPSHLSLDESVEWVRRVAPMRAILTHMHTPLDYEATRLSLPNGIEPGFDGLVIELPEK